jgi:hypothetical protein
MPQPKLEKFNRRGLALKLQVTPGTPEAPNPATDGLRLYDGRSGTEFDVLEDSPDRRHFSSPRISTWNHRAWIEGSLRVQPGSGANPPDADPLLRIAGMQPDTDGLPAGSVRYLPISEDIPCATTDFWHAGTLRRMHDVRAAISELSIQIGERATARLRMLGFYSGIGQQALPAVPVAEELGPVVEAENSEARIIQYPDDVAGDTLHVWAKSLSIDCGTRLTPKHYTQHREIGYDDRQPSFSLRIARTDLTEFDPWTLRADGTLITAALRVTGADGRYTEIGIRGYIRDVEEVEIDGDYGWEIAGPCVASPAGGDDFYVEFGNPDNPDGGGLPHAIGSPILSLDDEHVSEDGGTGGYVVTFPWQPVVHDEQLVIGPDVVGAPGPDLVVTIDVPGDNFLDDDPHTLTIELASDAGGTVQLNLTVDGVPWLEEQAIVVPPGGQTVVITFTRPAPDQPWDVVIDPPIGAPDTSCADLDDEPTETDFTNAMLQGPLEGSGGEATGILLDWASGGPLFVLDTDDLAALFAGQGSSNAIQETPPESGLLRLYENQAVYVVHANVPHHVACREIFVTPDVIPYDPLDPSRSVVWYSASNPEFPTSGDEIFPGGQDKRGGLRIRFTSDESGVVTVSNAEIFAPPINTTCEDILSDNFNRVGDLVGTAPQVGPAWVADVLNVGSETPTTNGTHAVFGAADGADNETKIAALNFGGPKRIVDMVIAASGVLNAITPEAGGGSSFSFNIGLFNDPDPTAVDAYLNGADFTVTRDQDTGICVVNFGAFSVSGDPIEYSQAIGVGISAGDPVPFDLRAEVHGSEVTFFVNDTAVFSGAGFVFADQDSYQYAQAIGAIGVEVDSAHIGVCHVVEV